MSDAQTVGTGEWPTGHAGPPALQGLIARWEERARFRWELAQMAAANPHLIEDIGLTTRQVEAEIAKRFWQA